MTAGLIRELQTVLGSQPLLAGTVTSVQSDGVVVTLPGGAAIRARGSASVNDVVFVRGGVIEGPAPALAPVTIDV
ncbi:MAG: hypothetical protein KDH20_22340 [Rhodocyclaceae bacterium]|nr:hypothetical protein [Rhodocyclaceae bacterium]